MMCGGRLTLARRSCCGVSPVRTKVRISTGGKPERLELRTDAGERGFEVAMNVVGERLER